MGAASGLWQQTGPSAIYYYWMDPSFICLPAATLLLLLLPPLLLLSQTKPSLPRYPRVHLSVLCIKSKLALFPSLLLDGWSEGGNRGFIEILALLFVNNVCSVVYGYSQPSSASSQSFVCVALLLLLLPLPACLLTGRETINNQYPAEPQSLLSSNPVTEPIEYSRIQ